MSVQNFEMVWTSPRLGVTRTGGGDRVARVMDYGAFTKAFVYSALNRAPCTEKFYGPSRHTDAKSWAEARLIELFGKSGLTTWLASR